MVEPQDNVGQEANAGQAAAAAQGQAAPAVQGQGEAAPQTGFIWYRVSFVGGRVIMGNVNTGEIHIN